MNDLTFCKTPPSPILKKVSKNNEEKISYSRMLLGVQESTQRAIDLVANLFMRPC